MQETTFKVTCAVLVVALLLVRGYYGWAARKGGCCPWRVGREAARREGLWSLLLRPLVFLALVTFIVVYATAPAGAGWWNVRLPIWLRWCGVGVAMLGLVLLVRVHHVLREYWLSALVLRSDHVLITAGPYGRVRHPMYLALLLFFAGIALVSAAWPLLALGAILPGFFRRVARREEAMMVERFGDQYRAYAETTGQFFPRWW